MKILFINLPYYGHVVPTIGLVQELIHEGCEVTYLMPFDWQERIAESSAVFHGYENHRKLSEQMKNAYKAADDIAEQFDFIVYEQFFFLGKHLAEKHNKPVARIFTAPVTNEKLMKEFIASGPLSVFQHKWIARAFTKDIAKGIALKTDNWLDEIIYDPPELNLVYTLREYQPYEAEFPKEHYLFLGPSIYERNAMPFDYEKREKHLVYISLGTVVKGAAAFFQNFLEAFRDEEKIDVIISVGHKFDRRKLKDIPPQVHIYSSVPQVEVLKMADVFVTHGGMNSVSEALVYGVPMVVVPFASDQPVNARCVEKLGVGKKLEKTEASADKLRKFVLSVLSDEKYKKNLEEIQNLIRQAPGNRGGAERIIEYYENSRRRDG